MEFITATVDHLPAIVRLLADDEFGVTRERYEIPLPKEYIEAFAKIEQQIGNSIIVAMDKDEVVGCLQLTIIPGISRLGTTRGQIEGVRVGQGYRGRGIGESLFRYAINEAKSMGCDMIQLTTDKKRKDAHRFYERLGFVDSHDGMKLVFSR
ncbi:GNAT family N-acetyltransferase [Paenibacillus sp. UASWS1643]|uniref:GNAT family N-acetyltransferase n=1 Tax=Paenibacillus sp. UASWS1643 TaxID=2580422 RepID=UPI00123A43D9|nr:GNAT family N-acetyltransferase [Paenibacillus sp. UASWS1643]KAA8745474.1 GNAT family N-acetyltransferase [Paenibacillus sp. UASWS1643]